MEARYTFSLPDDKRYDEVVKEVADVIYDKFSCVIGSTDNENSIHIIHDDSDYEYAILFTSPVQNFFCIRIGCEVSEEDDIYGEQIRVFDKLFWAVAIKLHTLTDQGTLVYDLDEKNLIELSAIGRVIL